MDTEPMRGGILVCFSSTGDVAEGPGRTGQRLGAAGRAEEARLTASPGGRGRAQAVGVGVVVQVEGLRVPRRGHAEPAWPENKDTRMLEVKGENVKGLR